MIKVATKEAKAFSLIEVIEDNEQLESEKKNLLQEGIELKYAIANKSRDHETSKAEVEVKIEEEKAWEEKCKKLEHN